MAEHRGNVSGYKNEQILFGLDFLFSPHKTSEQFFLPSIYGCPLYLVCIFCMLIVSTLICPLQLD